MAKRRSFSETREWRVVKRSPLVRFRPHLAQPREGWEITLPLARAAVRGRLRPVLGRSFRRCVALESLRLPRKRSGRPVGSVDLLLLSESGDVALGECKRAGKRRNLRYLRRAMDQLIKYERALQKSPGGWLKKRIKASYEPFGFPGLGSVLSRLGLKSATAKRRWEKQVEANCRKGRIGFFVAGPGPRGRIAVWPIGSVQEIRP